MLGLDTGCTIGLSFQVFVRRLAKMSFNSEQMMGPSQFSVTIFELLRRLIIKYSGVDVCIRAVVTKRPLDTITS